MLHAKTRRFLRISAVTLLASLTVMGTTNTGRCEVGYRPLPTYELPTTLSVFAREISQTLADRGTTSVVVLDFVDRASDASSPRGGLELLAERCGDHLSLRLAQRTEGICRTIAAERAREALTKVGLSADDQAGSGNWDALKRAFPDTDAVVQGAIVSVRGNLAELECALIDLASGKTIARFQGTSCLDFNDWARLGHSAFLGNFKETKDEPRYEEDLLGDLMSLSEGAHPLDDAETLLPIHMVVDGKRREGVFHNNDYLVPIALGEKFAIELQNRLAEVIHVKLLVNGRNTLPQKVIEKQVVTLVPMQRVPLTEARAWVLEPAERGSNPRGAYAIRGFVTSTGQQSEVREFQVGSKPLDPNTAGGNQQWGLITAAFYLNHETHIRSRERYDRDYPIEYDYEIGNLIAVIQIRLVDASAMPAMP